MIDCVGVGMLGCVLIILVLGWHVLLPFAGVLFISCSGWFVLEVGFFVRGLS